MTTTPKSPVWFTVTRYSDSWAVRYRTLDRLSGKSTWHRDYPTKEEAIAGATSNGWVHVKDWKEARALAQPLQRARYYSFRARVDARKGLVKISIGEQNGAPVRYVTPERAQAILADLGEPNKYGVIE